MAETLRSIIEGMEHTRLDIYPTHHPPTCPKCRLLAVLAEHEECDLVKRWEARMNPDEPFARAVYMECANELRDWLAVMPRIKARCVFCAQGFKPELHVSGRWIHQTLSDPVECAERAALEAEVKPAGNFLSKLTKEQVKRCAESLDFEEEP